jgi:hypothetical protein
MRMGDFRRNALVLAGYVAVSFGFFGWRLLPHPGRLILGQGDDPNIYIWSLGWWPHAIASWENPLVSHALYVPTGVNIAWTPSAPGLGLLLAPLTSIVGPVVAFNVAALLMPALSAWSAYRLCLYLTRSGWASFVGGYLYGFSTAALREVLPGNLNLAAVFLFPLVALFILRYLRAEIDGRGLVWRLGLALALQLTFSTEFAAALTVAIVISLVLGFALVPEVRPRIRAALAPIAASYAVGALLVAPFTYYLLFHFEGTTVVSDINAWGTDLFGFVVPAFVNGIGGTDLIPTGLQARVPSHSAYLGVPAVAVIIVYAIRNRRSPGARFLVAALLAAVVLTLGATLRVYGHTLFSLPWWRALAHVPGLNDALPFRLAVFSALAGAVVVAFWTATTRGVWTRRPVLVPVLAALAVAPAFWHGNNPHFNPIHPQRLAFFTAGTFRTCLAPNQTVAFIPFVGRSLLWQAESGFRFRLASDGLQPFPRYAPLNAFDADPIVFNLVFGSTKPGAATLLAFAGKHDVARVLDIPGGGYPAPAELFAMGPTARSGGVLVTPRCGAPPLTSRNLTGFVKTYGHPAESRPNVAWCSAGTFFLLPDGTKPRGTRLGATRALFIEGTGLTCNAPPPGYKRHGYATQGVQQGIYPYYSP